MSKQYPIISGRRRIRFLEKIGYQVVRTRGSHVRLRHPQSSQYRPTTVPLHKEMKPGTLMNILADANTNIDELKNDLAS